MDLNVGQLLLLPLDFVPEGTLACNGQLVSTSTWPKLFDVVTTLFGGNGISTFGLPNIPPKQTAAGQAINWVIVAEGPSFSSGSEALFGEVRLFVVPPPPNSPLAATWSRCDGNLININNNVALYSLLGTTFGGNGTTTFGLPNLAPIKLADGTQLEYYIAVEGMFPSTSCDATTPVYGFDQSYDCLLTTIFQVPYPSPGKLCGFALCQGQTLPVNNPWLAVFSLLGNRFGGQGLTSFLLPNLPAVDGISFALLYNGIYPSRS